MQSGCLCNGVRERDLPLPLVRLIVVFCQVRQPIAVQHSFHFHGRTALC